MNAVRPLALAIIASAVLLARTGFAQDCPPGTPPIVCQEFVRRGGVPTPTHPRVATLPPGQVFFSPDNLKYALTTAFLYSRIQLSQTGVGQPLDIKLPDGSMIRAMSYIEFGPFLKMRNVNDEAFDLPIFEQGVGDWAALIGVLSHGIAFADRLRFKINNLNTSIEFGTLNVDMSTDSINFRLDLQSANPTIVGEANAYSYLPFGVIPIPLGWRDELCPDINMTNMHLTVQLVMAVIDDQLSYNDVRVVLEAAIDGGPVGNAIEPVVDFKQKVKSSFESQVRNIFLANDIRRYLSEAFMQMVAGQAKTKVFFVTSVRLDQSGMLVSYPVR